VKGGESTREQTRFLVNPQLTRSNSAKLTSLGPSHRVAKNGPKRSVLVSFFRVSLTWFTFSSRGHLLHDLISFIFVIAAASPCAARHCRSSSPLVVAARHRRTALHSTASHAQHRVTRTTPCTPLLVPLPSPHCDR